MPHAQPHAFEIDRDHAVEGFLGPIAGLIGLPTSSAYVAAKHGVLGLTKTAAIVPMTCPPP